MNIQTETTPNPSSLKFLPGKTVMEKETADFRNVEEAKFSPFALNLFKIDGVEGVFFGSDFISITKADNHDWQYLESTIIETIRECYKSETAFILAGQDNAGDTSTTEDTEAVIQIKKLKLKIQIKIQGEELRAEGKKRDDLQEAMTAISAIDIGLPIEFVNFRD